MLVPNSNTEYRALIGDRDADDTTDLSDNASDSEEQGEYKSDMKKVLDSKHVIGGKPKVEECDFEPDSLTIIDGVDDDFEKLVEKMDDDVTVDAIINEINDNKATIDETNNANSVDQVDSGKLLISIDSGPLTKAEFALKEEIHRTLLNGNTEEFMDELSVKTNGDILHNGHAEVNNVDSFTNNKGEWSVASNPAINYSNITDNRKVINIKIHQNVQI